MATATYGVHSYHLNVGAGDSAIHLLVQKNTGSRLWMVLKAVLIDGGPAIGFPVLAEAIERITNDDLYIIPTVFQTKKQLQFDSIVVTHWDSDHYHGIEKLLASDLQAQRTAGGAGVNVATLRSRYMKYDLTNAPQTVFYAPYWLVGESRTPGQTKEKADSWDRSTTGNYLQIRIGKTAADWVMRVANLCTVTGDGATTVGIGMIGRNFFWNGTRGFPMRSQVNVRTINNPQAMILGMTDPDRPGLYCIGADSVVIGHGPVAFHDPSDIPGVIDGGKDTAVNRASIMCVVVNSHNIVLHYFAGDVAFESEQHLPTWIAQPSRIVAMKLGHHGAASSSPVALLDEMQPQYLVVSCGAEHGHPSQSKMVPIICTVLTPSHRI
jgi:hypothetical protein